MAEMKTERKSVLEYLSKNKFLIPMYQRTYVWSEDECEQLYDDIYSFFINKEEENEDYFLGSVVVFKENNKQNIIDGQQRTTTLSLFIRALYEKALSQKSNDISVLLNHLSSCLWDTNQLNGDIDYSKPHLKSDVAIDSDNELLEKILSDSYEYDKEKIDDIIKKSKSNYEKNYLFFVKKIDELAKEQPTSWFKFCLCLLRDCIVLPIECDGQENALRIFNTLNNRGVSLSVSDIFKGLIYQSKENKEQRELFAKEWKSLETQIGNSPYLKNENMGFLFTQYEHIIRALHNEVDTVIPSPLEFFTKKDKANSKSKKVNFGANDDMLVKDETLDNIKELANFWSNPKEYMSYEAQKYFDILSIFQNRLWQMVLSMCFYEYKPEKNPIDSNIFDEVLPQIVSYCAIGLIYGKGGNAGLFWGFMKANINIKEKKDKIFESSLNISNLAMPKLEYFLDFSTKALPKQIRFILSIYVLIYDNKQEWEWNHNKKNYSVIKGEIEHIFPQKWQNTNYNSWNIEDAKKYLEQIGNKMLIEKKINIEAGNGYFGKKKEKYKDSKFLEAKELANYPKDDWLKEDIEKRNEEIYERLKEFFAKNL